MNKTILKTNNITKIFGDVIANNKINFEVGYHEVHAILGENGAGKSTLMNIISGVYLQDEGTLYFEDQEVQINSPKDSINLGISMIYQHFQLVESMTVFENLLIGQSKSFFIDKKSSKKAFQKIIEKYHLDIDLQEKVESLSMGKKQLVEVIKVLLRKPKLLIFDEPTTVLTVQEVDVLFSIIKKLKQNGYSIIFISHKLNEVMSISDKITILRKGTTVQTLETANTNPYELTKLMVGKKVDLKIKEVKQIANPKKLLEVKDITVEKDNIKKVKNLSFEVFEGEILGIAGISGHGQKELCEAIMKILDLKSGEILLEGKSLNDMSTLDILKNGLQMSFVPEDRLGMGLVPSMNIVDNMMLKEYYKQRFFINKTSSIKKAKEIVEELNISTHGVFKPIKDMSGGNIQKVLIGRELKLNPKVLITAYPVRGLDITTTYKIYDMLQVQKSKGVGIIYIAEDLDALLEISDKIMVMFRGENMGIYQSSMITKEQIGLLMVGEKIDE